MTDFYKETQDLMEMRKAMEADEIPEEAIKDTLLANAEAFESKAIAVYQAADEVDYDLVALDAMIKDLQTRKAVLKNRQESMRGLLLEAMITLGITQVSCPYFTISTKRKPQALLIEDEKQLPDEYVDVKVETKPKKAEIAKALRAGEEVAGAKLVDGGVGLQVRKK